MRQPGLPAPAAAPTTTCGPGDDALSGDDAAMGADFVPVTGDDVLEGGLAADLLTAADGIEDRVLCGDGYDVVRADGGDRVARDCELLIARRGNPRIAGLCVTLRR